MEENRKGDREKGDFTLARGKETGRREILPLLGGKETGRRETLPLLGGKETRKKGDLTLAKC